MYRESTSGLVNTYMSAVAHRSNEIMKVLTLLTSVFVPPTFLAGIYGMNFSSMPELDYAWAYPAALSLMLAMIGGTLLYFYQRGWLSGIQLRPNRRLRWRNWRFRFLETSSWTPSSTTSSTPTSSASLSSLLKKAYKPRTLTEGFAAHTDHGSRSGRPRRLLASGSSMNVSDFGSIFNVRPRIQDSAAA